MTTSSDTVTASDTPSASSTASASDFDISKVDINTLPEEYQKIIKGYQGDYTKKTQAISERGKTVEAKEKEAEKWINWYDKNQGLISEFNKWREGAADPDDDPGDKGSTDDDETPLTVGDLKQLEKKFKDRNDQSDSAFSQGFQMLVQLQALQAKSGSDVVPDPVRVIAYAKEKNLTDVKDAYEGAYAEEILAAKISKAVETEKEKWEEKAKTDVLNVNMPKGREVRKILARDRKK